MAEALNRSEVESLLTALNPVRASFVETQETTVPNVASPGSSSQLAKRVVGIFEKIRRQMSAVAEQCLQESLRFKRYMPERLPFSDMIQQSGEGTIYLMVESEQNGGDILVCLEKRFARQFASRMVGQISDADNRVTDLSHIEKRLLIRWVREILTGVMPPSQWRIVEVEMMTEERDFATYNPQSPWWCEKWELKSDKLRGAIQVSGQWEFFSSLAQETAPQDVTPTFREAPIPPDQLEVTAIWGEAELLATEKDELIVGSILRAKSSVGKELPIVSLEVAGRTVATGQAGESEGVKAVEIHSVKKVNFPDQV